MEEGSELGLQGTMVRMGPLKGRECMQLGVVLSGIGQWESVKYNEGPWSTGGTWGQLVKGSKGGGYLSPSLTHRVGSI